MAVFRSDSPFGAGDAHERVGSWSRAYGVAGGLSAGNATGIAMSARRRRSDLAAPFELGSADHGVTSAESRACESAPTTCGSV